MFLLFPWIRIAKEAFAKMVQPSLVTLWSFSLKRIAGNRSITMDNIILNIIMISMLVILMLTLWEEEEDIVILSLPRGGPPWTISYSTS